MNYIFRLPQNARDTVWTFDALEYDMTRGMTGREWRDRFGTTLHPYHVGPDRIDVQLYDTVIAVIHRSGRIYIPYHVNDHISHATREWLTLITGRRVYSENFRYNVAGKAFKNGVMV